MILLKKLLSGSFFHIPSGKLIEFFRQKNSFKKEVLEWAV